MSSTTVRAPVAGAAATEAPMTDGFHLLVDALKFNGVQTMYGVVGIPVTDLARIAQASGIRYIGFRHEASAGNAAAAASMARRASSRFPAGTREATPPVNGFFFSYTLPSSAPVHSPLMKTFSSRTATV